MRDSQNQTMSNDKKEEPQLEGLGTNTYILPLYATPARVTSRPTKETLNCLNLTARGERDSHKRLE